MAIQYEPFTLPDQPLWVWLSRETDRPVGPDVHMNERDRPVRAKGHEPDHLASRADWLPGQGWRWMAT